MHVVRRSEGQNINTTERATLVTTANSCLLFTSDSSVLPGSTIRGLTKGTSDDRTSLVSNNCQR